MSKRPQIVILGAGYGGLCVAHRLQQLTKPEHCAITLIDRNSYHVNTIDLHEVAMGNAYAQDVSFPLMPIIKMPHARVLMAEVTAVDLEAKVVHTSVEDVPYDICVIALGFVPETFGIPGMMEHAFQITNVPESEKIHRHLEERFRAYAATDDIDRDLNDISILVGGSGFTGIELLGEMVERVDHLCKKYDIRREHVTIRCVSADKRMLPMFDDEEVDFIVRYLESKGVQFQLDATISKATPQSFLFTDAHGVEQEYFANTRIWTGGVSGSPLMKDIFGDAVRRGRLIVESDLMAPGHDDLYVIGDCAAFISPGAERPEPTTAQVATQMGYHVAENINRQLRHRARKNFTYKYRGTVCSLGAHTAVADLGQDHNRTLTGFFAMRLKLLIESVTDYKISGLYNAVKCTRVFKLKNF